MMIEKILILSLLLFTLPLYANDHMILLTDIQSYSLSFFFIILVGLIIYVYFLNNKLNKKILKKEYLKDEINESKQQLQTIFENAQVGLMYITGERKLINANQRLADILGYETPESMFGISMQELHINEKNFVEFGYTNFYTLKLRKNLNIEYQLKRKDGSAIWCELSGKAIDKNIPADLSQGVLWVINDISKRKLYQKSLEESESKYRALFKGNKAIELIIDSKDGKIIDCNDKAVLYYGYSYEELISKYISDINVLTKEELQEEMLCAKDEIRDFFKFKHKLSSGEIRDVEVISGPIEFEGKSLLYSIIFDATEKNRLRKYKDETQERLRLALAGTEDGIWDWNLITNEVYFSPRYKEILGYTDEELKNTFETWKELLHPDDIKRSLKSLDKYINRDIDSFEIKFRMRHKDGHYVPILSRGKKFVDNSKAIRLIGTHVDLTKTAHYEEKIKESEENLQEAQKIARLGYFKYDLEKEIFSLSKEFNDIHGIDEKYDKALASCLMLIDPKDKERIREYFYARIGDKSNIDTEYRIIQQETQEIIWIHALGHFVQDETNNNVLSLFGTVQDITERKNIELKLQQAMTVFNNTHDGIMVTDEYAKIINVNKSFMNTTGYTLDEVENQNPNILKSGLHDKQFYQKMWSDINNNGFWIGEVQNKNKVGRIYQELLTINTVCDKEGNVLNYIGVFSDISIQKEQEKMLLLQSKTAAIGEMLSNISHQWRQPLSIISTLVTGLKLSFEFGEEVSQKDITKTLDSVNDNAQHLSKTIDDFRNFFMGDLNSTMLFNVKDALTNVHELTNDSFSNSFISYEASLNDFEIKQNKNIFIQALINIYNNAKDVLVEKVENCNDRLFLVSLKREGTSAIISLKDSGGGIDDDIKEKIFEPYFTTKHESIGTGIGLYMTYQIITKQMAGRIIVQNTEFEYKGNKYYGAEFVITLNSVE